MDSFFRIRETRQVDLCDKNLAILERTILILSLRKLKIIFILFNLHAGMLLLFILAPKRFLCNQTA
jgi:hypothetical protein